MHPHLPRDVGQHLVSVLQLDAEHGVGEGFDDRALQYDRIFFRFRQSGASPDGWDGGSVTGARRTESPARPTDNAIAPPPKRKARRDGSFRRPHGPRLGPQQPVSHAGDHSTPRPDHSPPAESLALDKLAPDGPETGPSPASRHWPPGSSRNERFACTMQPVAGPAQNQRVGPTGTGRVGGSGAGVRGWPRRGAGVRGWSRRGAGVRRSRAPAGWAR